ncbi:AmmeMemoRadiSam system protein A [uncultured Shewanella sp.]|uniref:AmmeMemoRadiSam system protein A n=1 Tax=Shewanella atlantica TaxID=271099 RepID=UPI0026309E23|nr:AmmeMemoRadiSam system protein A [uncultured Shewanella sp.]
MPASPSINLSQEEKQRLLALARETLVRYFASQQTDVETPAGDPLLSRRAGCFVTLFLDGDLSGCMGDIEGRRPLAKSIPELALCSAFKDNRFAPLLASQMERLTIEISLLSPLTQLTVHDEAELLRYLTDHPYGVVLSDPFHRSVYLPQVWEQLPQPREFIRELKCKGGWSADYWSGDMRVEIFTVGHFREQESTD